ncbi:MAG: two-component system sensor histidine kinase CreC [Planctomycetes bacterium]|nr:two-component system sensor histidine kinase CreC [Planctomycetota bacterium]
MKIRARIIIGLLVVVGLGFYYLVDWIGDDLRPRYLESMEESMVDTSVLLASLLEARMEGGALRTEDLHAAFDAAGRREFSARIYEMEKTALQMRVYVTDARGTVVFDSAGGEAEGEDYSRWNDVVRTLRGEYGARTTRDNPEDPTTTVLYVAAPVRADGRMAGVVTVAKPAKSVQLFIDTAKRKLITGGMAIAAATILLGVLVTVWLTRPIEKLTAYARAVGDGKRALPPRLGRSEIGMLGEAFEEMREALEGKKYAENYVQTLAHEIKGPLSTIRGAAELLEEEMPGEKRRRFTANVREESMRIQQAVDELLELSGLEGRDVLADASEADCGEIAAEVAESMRPAAEAKGLSVRVEREGDLRLVCERALVRRAIGNLLRNAVDFSPAGGEVGVAVSGGGGYVTVEVCDKGPGVPDYALGKVFDKFYSLPRPETGAKSSGLGLSIVREIAVLHGGDAGIANMAGGGARATLRLARGGGADVTG